MSHDCPFGGRCESKSLEGCVERTDKLFKEDGQIYCADPSPLTSLSVLDASVPTSGGAYVAWRWSEGKVLKSGCEGSRGSCSTAVADGIPTVCVLHLTRVFLAVREFGSVLFVGRGERGEPRKHAIRKGDGG